MRLQHLFGLLAMGLCTISATAFAAPPHPCPGPDPLPAESSSPSNWKDWLPTVVIGIDHRPDSRLYHQFEGDPFSAAYETAATGPLVNHHHRDSMTRFTAGLRWTSRSSSSSESLPDLHSRNHLRCQTYLHLKGLPPETLSEAIDHWSHRSALRSLLNRREGKR